MIKIEGHGRPTKFKAAEKGTIYTDLDTGKRYKCLGLIGFVDSDAVEEPIEYNWSLVDQVGEEQLSEGTGGGGNSGPVAWADVQDKPFGEKNVIVDLIEENRYIGSSPDYESYEFENFDVCNNWNKQIIEGAKYIVKWEGTEYECIGQYNSNLQIYYFGNPGMSRGYYLGEDNGIPFVFYHLADSPQYLRATSTKVVEYATFSLKMEDIAVHTLESKYLNEALQFWENVETKTLIDVENLDIPYSDLNEEYEGDIATLDSTIWPVGSVAHVEAIDNNGYSTDEYIEITSQNELAFNGYNDSSIRLYRFNDSNCTIITGTNVQGFTKLKISLTITDLKPIDEKYIPDTIARKSDISGGGGNCVHAMVKMDSDGDLVLLNTTFDELKNAFLNDIPVHYVEYHASRMVPKYMLYSNDEIYFDFNDEQYVLYSDGTIELFEADE